MKEIFYKLIGRLTLSGELIHSIVKPKEKPSTIEIKGQEYSLDRTGILLQSAKPIEILYNKEGILFPLYDSLAHSFWRCQELSLFSRYINLLKRPLLDFGCGDGSFSSVLFREIDYGVDIDDEALTVAKEYDIYENLLQPANDNIPLSNNSIFSVISNSVLEHLLNLETVFHEIHRILMPDGIFVFTVPVVQFRHAIAEYFGEKTATRINNEYYHRNLLDTNQWRKYLEDNGFSIILIKEYQPDLFTFWYMMFRIFGKRGIGYFIADINLKVWKHFNQKIINMVKSSINETERGSNIFVIAKKGTP